MAVSDIFHIYRLLNITETPSGNAAIDKPRCTHVEYMDDRGERVIYKATFTLYSYTFCLMLCGQAATLVWVDLMQGVRVYTLEHADDAEEGCPIIPSWISGLPLLWISLAEGFSE